MNPHCNLHGSIQGCIHLVPLEFSVVSCNLIHLIQRGRVQKHLPVFFLTLGSFSPKFLEKNNDFHFCLKNYPFLSETSQEKINQLLTIWGCVRSHYCQTTNIDSACIFWNKYWLSFHYICLLFSILQKLLSKIYNKTEMTWNFMISFY